MVSVWMFCCIIENIFFIDFVLRFEYGLNGLSTEF